MHIASVFKKDGHVAVPRVCCNAQLKVHVQTSLLESVHRCRTQRRLTPTPASLQQETVQTQNDVQVWRGNIITYNYSSRKLALKIIIIYFKVKHDVPKQL